MNHKPIISRGEALQILKNDLRRAALEKHADELPKMTPERRGEILKEIDREVQKELLRRTGFWSIFR